MKNFVKGYLNDAGVDVILNEDVTFAPSDTTVFDLGIHITPEYGQMAMLFSRTSAAAKGLITASCPIDPDYSGTCTAIVHNISKEPITYKKGQSFCQYVLVNVLIDRTIPTKKQGKRSDGKLGSTGN